MIAFIQKRKYKGGKVENGLSELCSTQVALSLEATILTPQIKPKKGKYPVFINWGVTDIPWFKEVLEYHFKKFGVWPRVINEPFCIAKAVNKIKSFQAMQEAGDVNIPRFTTLKSEAESWFDEDSNAMVFCRVLPSSFQGKGIVIATKKEELVNAPLYTLRCKKKWEYRVHVVLGDIVRIQQKKRLSSEHLQELGITPNNGLVRSYNQGYRFTTNLDHPLDSDIIKNMSDQAIKAVKALGLDFGAVDILLNSKGKPTILEVNTAPGIEGGTVEAYAAAFHKHFSNEVIK